MVTSHTREPVYDGKPISYWIDHPTNYYPTVGNFYKGGEFPKSVDARAVPYLIRALKRGEGPLQPKYNAAWWKFPAWMQKMLPYPYPSVIIRASAANELARLGPAAKPAIPALTAASTKDDDDRMRRTAAYALAELQKQLLPNGTTNLGAR